MKDNNVTALYVAMITFVLLVWVGSSYMEAKTYNKITGSDVTIVDAMFSNLRVTGVSKND